MNSSTLRASSSVTIARSRSLNSVGSPHTSRQSSSAVRAVWSSRASASVCPSVRAANPASRPASHKARCSRSATPSARPRSAAVASSDGKRASRSTSLRGDSSLRPYPPVAISATLGGAVPCSSPEMAANICCTTSSVSAEIERTTSCPPAPARWRSRISALPASRRVRAAAAAGLGDTLPLLTRVPGSPGCSAMPRA